VPTFSIGFEQGTTGEGIEVVERAATRDDLAGQLDGDCRLRYASSTHKFPIEKDYIRFCPAGTNFESLKKLLSATSLLPPASSSQVHLRALGISTKQS
jgi:hypothetical protein